MQDLWRTERELTDPPGFAELAPFPPELAMLNDLTVLQSGIRCNTNWPD
jgi:hypothetical protein